MKRALYIAIILSVLLIGCKSPTQKLIVETRPYSGDESGLEYESWDRNNYPVEAGQKVLSSNDYHISARIDKVHSNGVRIKFSGEVVYPDKNESSDNFLLEKNRTYIFVAGGGIQGLEIKMRYN